MTVFATSPALNLYRRSLADIEAGRCTVYRLTEDDRTAIMQGAQEFVGTLYDEGRPFDSKRVWLRTFFAHLRRRMTENGRDLERALDTVDYQDCPYEQSLIQTEERMEYQHGMYCRAMINRGKGW